MPYGDRTGPLGMGPTSGRAAGFCAGYGMPGYLNPIPGRGFGLGFGRGRGFWGRGFGGGGHGWRRWYYATGLPGWMRLGGYAPPYGYPFPYPKPDPNVERQALENQVEALQKELEIINQRLSELKAESSPE